MDTKAIPAAQYLRMSTEHQQYSLQNQSSSIQKYADAHGFEIVMTYSDAARSGLVLKSRAGLRQLLEEVLRGAAAYRAILVYDVSRWGRFQDIDESAHYEFLCKSAGVPVIYCAESFADDATLSGLIMKALKRTMAGEYSRELSVKVYDGQKRLTLLGFKTGGKAGYGLRRMLVSASGVRKQEFGQGERKSIATDRVILVPGPAHEVQVIKSIYRMFVEEKRSISFILDTLKRDGVPREGYSREWTRDAISEILTNPKYTGCAVYGRTTRKLGTPDKRLPRSEWSVKPDAFEPVIDGELFAQAQRVFQGFTINKIDAELLGELRALLASRGRLSVEIIQSANISSPSTYIDRFGSMRNVYELIGYEAKSRFERIDVRKHRYLMREELIHQIAEIFPGDISILARSGRASSYRKLLRLSGGPTVSVLIAPSVLIWKTTRRWCVTPVKRESKLLTLLGRLNEDDHSFFDFNVFPLIDRRGKFFLPLKNDWLRRGKQLDKLSDFREVVREVHAARKRTEASVRLRR